ncbi:MAG: hypothetical protein LKF31_01035 [Muribaculaceae bacterium]|nr:hypothetical protein [Muribaculaceae bacterium]
MAREDSIKHFLNGRYFVIITIVMLIGATLFSESLGCISGNTSSYGICFLSSNLWVGDRLTSVLLNLLLILLIAMLMGVLNKSFNFIRAVTYISSSMFFMLELANPYATSQLYSGTLMCLVVLIAVFIMFRSYDNNQAQHSIFIVFVLLGLCCMAQYAFIFMMPIFFIGFCQMRIMSLRGLLAMLLGVIAPFWILVGLGVVPITSFTFPKMVSVWSALSMPQISLLIIIEGVTAFIGIVLLLLNMNHIFNYRKQIRSYNGFFSVLMGGTIVMMAIDYRNLLTYVPLLNTCVAIQLGHFYTINTHSRRYILILVLTACCIFSFAGIIRAEL